tara:strand:- start:309 stop:668 length:360 start_codon:yes stop_codon:yes gene_type:complete
MLSCDIKFDSNKLLGHWENKTNNKKMELLIKGDNECEINLSDSNHGINEMLKGKYQINHAKSPSTLDVYITSPEKVSLYTIIDNINENSIRVAKFSQRWRLRPIAFNDSNTMFFYRKKL